MCQPPAWLLLTMAAASIAVAAGDSGVVDWEIAAIGPPLLDVGWLMMIFLHVTALRVRLERLP